MPSVSVASPTPRSWSEFISPIGRVQLLVVAALFLFIYWSPIQNDLIWKWTNDGNWSHGWLLPLFSLYFLSTRRDELFRCRIQPNMLGAVVIALSLLMYFVSAWVYLMGYPKVVSLLGVLFGLVLLFGGWKVARLTWFPIAYLILAIPLPQGIYVDITMPMQKLASQVAGLLMPVLTPGLLIEVQGITIDFIFEGRASTLNVEEACSGMRLMMAFVALGVAMAYLGERPIWQRILMVLSCIPIALICNTVRVTTTGLFYVHGRTDLAKGTPHELLGILMLGLAFALYALVGFVLNRLIIEESD